MPALPHQTVHAVFPHTAFRCSSPQSMRLRPACCPFLPLDGLEGNAIDPGAPFVGADKIIGMTEDVRPVNLVVQGVEAAGRLLLGLAVELPLKCPDAFRGC